MKIINFFAETIAVNGACRSIIYDIPRNKYYFIPNILFGIINKYNKKPKEKLFNDFPKEIETLNEYISFLEVNEVIFYTSSIEESKLFPKLNLQWDFPAKITNAILEIDKSSKYNLIEIVNQLIELNCYRIQIISFDSKSIEFWDNFFLKIIYSPIISVEIFTKYSYSTDIDFYINLVEKHKRIKLLFLHSADKNEYLNT